MFGLGAGIGSGSANGVLTFDGCFGVVFGVGATVVAGTGHGRKVH